VAVAAGGKSRVESPHAPDRELWQILLGRFNFMSPMTYAVNGRQYVSITVGNGLFTFALPQ